MPISLATASPLCPPLPAVDVTETDKAYQITAQSPGMDEKSVEVNSPTGFLI